MPRTAAWAKIFGAFQAHETKPSGGEQVIPEGLEDGDFEVEEFFGILAEVADQETQVAGEAAEIVVELRVGK